MIGYAKKIEKIIRESAFDKKKKKPGLKFNPGLALTSVRTTGLKRFFLPTNGGRNECVANEPQRASAGRLRRLSPRFFLSGARVVSVHRLRIFRR